jgi:hypothetical protein
MNSPGRRIGFLLTSVPAVEAISVQLGEISALQQALDRALPAGLGRLCRVARITDGVIVLEAQTSAAAAKLKALSPRLLAAFRRVLPTLAAVQVRVAVSRRNKPARTAVRRIGPTAIGSLAALAGRLPSGPLEAALRCLLRHQRGSERQDEALEREERQHDQHHDDGVLEGLPPESQPAPLAGDNVHQHRPADRQQDQEADDA